MENIKLEVKHSYLVKFGYTKILRHITIVSVVNKAYLVLWHNNDTTSRTWEFKGYFEDCYEIIEDITDWMESEKSEQREAYLLANGYLPK